MSNFRNIIENILKDEEIISTINLIIKRSGNIIKTIDKFEEKKNSGNIMDYCIKSISSIIYNKYHCKYKYYLANNLQLKSYYNYHSEEFINALSNANYGYGTWEPDWEIVEIEDNEQLKISKNGLTLWINKNQLIPNDKKDYFKGKKGFLWIGKEFRQLLPGFYSALSNIPFYHATNKNSPTLRIYWNIRLEFSTRLTQFLTRELNALKIPFFFKILRDPHGFSRTDAAILYINKFYFKENLENVLNIYRNVNIGLNTDTSIFTKYIAPGFSLAEEPISLKNESFGQHYSRILAEAISHEYLHTSTLNSFHLKIEQIIKFAKEKAAGIDFEKPYLDHDSNDDDYEIFKNKIELVRR